MSRDVAPVVRAITQEQLHAYADASGDHNPIHVDPEFARRTPFGGTIAHGMLVLALIGEMMYAAFGDEWSTSGKLKVRFKAPTRPGDTVTASAQLSKESGGVAEYAVQCASQTGEVLIEGRASVAVPA
jgi:3-hydroxybutyryl-CoA dehydratase